VEKDNKTVLTCLKIFFYLDRVAVVVPRAYASPRVLFVCPYPNLFQTTNGLELIYTTMQLNRFNLKQPIRYGVTLLDLFDLRVMSQKLRSQAVSLWGHAPKAQALLFYHLAQQTK
jgi:hypothetical protein